MWRGLYLWREVYLWRGDLSPMGREAAPAFDLKEGPAAQSIGDKSPRHSQE